MYDNAVENVRLEFKLEVPGKDETLKKVSSFANTFGGYIVVGAKAASSDGRLEGLPGVTPQNGYKQTVIQWCFAGATPPLNAEVSDPIPAPGASGTVCYVVYIAESDLAPHFLNARKGVYIRTDEFSARFEARLASENELRYLFDRRKLVRDRRNTLLQRARKRFETYTALTNADSGEGDSVLHSLLEMSVVPRFPARPVCETGKLKNLVTSNLLGWRGCWFPDNVNDLIFQHESVVVRRATQDVSLFEANIWGMVFYCTRIHGEHYKQTGIHLYEVVGDVILFLTHASAVLGAMGYQGPLVIETTLSSLLGAQWLYPMNRIALHARKGAEVDDEVSFSTASTTEELSAKLDAVAMEVLRTILFAVNSPDLVRSTNLEALMRCGYEFNSWDVPEQFRR